MAKRRFSIGEALGEGFHVAGRRPVSVFVWGLIMLIPSFLPLAILGPSMMALPLAEMAGGSVTDSPAFRDYMLQSQIANGLSTALQLITWGVLGAAVYRVILLPKSARRRLFSLGFGMDEVRVAVAYLALGVGAVVLMIGLLLIMAGIGLASWPHLTDAGKGWAVAGLMFVALLILLGAYARVCLIPPTCVARGDFTFGEGWRLGAGQTGKLALMTLLLWLLACVVALMAYALLFAVGAGVWMGMGLELSWPDDPASFGEMIPDDPRILWLAAGLLVPLTWVYGLTAVIGLAPYASAVRQLTPEPAAEAPASSDTSNS